MNLMGLLEDKDALMTLAASLLSARKGQEGAALGQGLLGAMQAKRQNEGLALDRQGKEQSLLMGKMQLDQMRRAGEQQSAIQSLGQRAFAPPQQLDPRQQEGGQQEVPGGGGMGEYLQGMMGIDPMKALGMQSQLAQMNQRNVQKVGPGETLFDLTGGKPVFSAPEKEKLPERGKIREVFKGGNVIQEEWNGEKWSPVGQGPRFKPNEPEKAPSPQLFNGPNGPVWVTPPQRGQAETVPVTGPDGKPIPGTKPEKALTESQGTASFYLGMMKEAEKSLSTSNFDPSTAKNQTMLAFARGDIPILPKVAQNAVASAPSQKYAQGMYQWTEAMLRATTGATAPEPEVWRVAKTYFTMPGDGPEVIAQKTAQRKQMQEYMRIKAGQGADKVDGVQAAGGWSIRPLD